MASLRSTLVLTGKELKQMFLSPIAYVFLIGFVFSVTFMFFRAFFLVGEASMAGFFFWIPLLFAIVIPGITMRSWSEERKQGTIEFLLTAPIETGQIVLAKFLAALVLVACCLLLTIMVPFTVSSFGDLDAGPVIGGYLGALLLGGTCIAIGMFCSSFTQDQIVAFLVSVVVLLFLVLLGYEYFQSEFGAKSTLGWITRVVSPTTHYEQIGRGVIDIRNIWYFGATIALFLYLNARVIDLRRWR